MLRTISRRKVLAAGAASIGALMCGTLSRKTHAWQPGPKENVERNLDDAEDVINGLKEFRVDMDAIFNKLLEDGVKAFENSFKS